MEMELARSSETSVPTYMPNGVKNQEDDYILIAYLPLNVINMYIKESGYNKRYLPLANGKSLLSVQAH
jgi:hypothetical protein